MKIHVCLISDQTLANLIPALMERPDKVVLVATAEMKRRKQDEHLRSVFAAHGIATESVEDAPDVSLGDIRRYADALNRLLTEMPEKTEITLNATGGTKLMMLGFVEVFRQNGARVLYTDTAHRRIEIVGSDEAAPMSDVLDVPSYLAAQRLNYLQAASDTGARAERMRSRRQAADFLARNAARLESFLRSMNSLADKALGKDGHLEAPLQYLHYPPHPNSLWAEALHELARAKCIGWQDGSNEVVFLDEERTQFVRGGWLEEYAFQAVSSANPFDVRLGVEVGLPDGERVQNEFDVLACRGNQLLFIECKSLKFVEGQNDSDLSYKLQSLGERARGLFGETWLLTAQSPTANLIERSHQARFRLITPAELPDLRKRVLDWIKGDGRNTPNVPKSTQIDISDYVGCFEGGPEDLASNSRHLADFGKV